MLSPQSRAQPHNTHTSRTCSLFCSLRRCARCVRRGPFGAAPYHDGTSRSARPPRDPEHFQTCRHLSLANVRSRSLQAAPIVNHGLPHAKLSPAADLNLVQGWIDVNNTYAMEASSAVNVCGVNCAWTTLFRYPHTGRSKTCGARVMHRAWKSFGGNNTQACAAVAKNWPTICGGCDPEYVASPPPPAAPPAMSDHTTGCNEANGKENMYLDRHVVKCPVGSALSDFKFTNHGCR